jgi:hypothetical protein
MRKNCDTCKHWMQDDKHTGKCQVTGQRRGNENTCRDWVKKDDEQL